MYQRPRTGCQAALNGTSFTSPLARSRGCLSKGRADASSAGRNTTVYLSAPTKWCSTTPSNRCG
jgi:hypothetical protein